MRVPRIEPLHQHGDALNAGELVHRRLRPARIRPVANDGLAHGQALPVAPINFLLAPLHFCSAGHILRRLSDQFLREIHHALVVGVGLIELQHGELRIPAPAQALVAEVAIDFIHAIESAHHQPLQIKFRRDAQVQIHVERVVVRHKRTRHRAACDGLHHRRLDFDKSMGFHRAPQ